MRRPFHSNRICRSDELSIPLRACLFIPLRSLPFKFKGFLINSSENFNDFPLSILCTKKTFQKSNLPVTTACATQSKRLEY